MSASERKHSAEETRLTKNIQDLIKNYTSQFDLSSSKGDVTSSLAQIKKMSDERSKLILQKLIVSLTEQKKAIEQNLIIYDKPEFKQELATLTQLHKKISHTLQTKEASGLSQDDLINIGIPDKIYAIFHIALRDLDFAKTSRPDMPTISEIYTTFYPLFQDALAAGFPKKETAPHTAPNHPEYTKLLNLLINIVKNNQDILQAVIKSPNTTMFATLGQPLSKTQIKKLLNYLKTDEMPFSESVLIRGSALEQLQQLRDILLPASIQIAAQLKKGFSSHDDKVELRSANLSQITHPADKLIACFCIGLNQLDKATPEKIAIAFTEPLFRISTINMESLARNHFKLDWLKEEKPVEHTTPAKKA